MRTLIIGDIAGRADELKELCSNARDYGKIITVGDRFDRGKQSKEVFEYLSQRTDVISLFGNHEDMLLDMVQRTDIYEGGMGGHPFSYNGGIATLDSFGYNIPDEVIDWIEHMPFSIELKCKKSKPILVSHSFIPPHKTLQEASTRKISNIYYPDNILWSRQEPIRRDEYSLQIVGHNSQFKYRWFSDDKGVFALSIDTSKERALTGIVVNTDYPPKRNRIEIYQVEYKS